MTEIPFGVSYDCTGESWWEKRWGPCKLYGRFQLDIRGTGLAISESVGWIADGWRGEIRDFTRSSDSTEVSCLVIGWPAKCTPNSTMNVEPLNPQEVSGTAQTVICA
ncbi:uncharacterized protein LOC134253549 [Saccostrea cucullata]|uniref:uncharacterized protein LOC134253549 n=1 Tax=Saccostrea cuccullata TaxID=36930 RepID=UPI002ED6827C